MKYILAVFCVVLLSGCAASKQSESTLIDQSTTDDSLQKADSSLYVLNADIRQSLEQFRDFLQEKKVNKTTTNYSQPDSTGKQHMTSQEVYHEQTNTKETEHQNEVTEISIKQLEKQISILEQEVKKLNDISIQNASEQKNIMDSITNLVWALIILLVCAFAITLFIKRRK